MNSNPHQSNFHTIWFKDCTTDEQRDSRRKLLVSSRVFTELLLELINERNTKAARPNLQEYDSPAWQYKLAHKNGQLEELDYLTQLLRPLTSKTYHDR